MTAMAWIFLQCVSYPASAIEIALAEDDARKQATSDKFLEKAAKFVADAEKILKVNGGKYFVGDKVWKRKLLLKVGNK